MRSLLRLAWGWCPGRMHRVTSAHPDPNARPPVRFALRMKSTVFQVIALLLAGSALSIASLTVLAGPPDAGSGLTSPGPTPTHFVFLALVQKRYNEPPPPLEVVAEGWLRPKPEFNPCLWGSHFLEDDHGVIQGWIRSDVIRDWDLYEGRYVQVRGAEDTPISGCPPRIIVTTLRVLREITPTPMPTSTPTSTPTPTPTSTPPD